MKKKYITYKCFILSPFIIIFIIINIISNCSNVSSLGFNENWMEDIEIFYFNNYDFFINSIKIEKNNKDSNIIYWTSEINNCYDIRDNDISSILVIKDKKTRKEIFNGKIYLKKETRVQIKNLLYTFFIRTRRHPSRSEDLAVAVVITFNKIEKDSKIITKEKKDIDKHYLIFLFLLGGVYIIPILWRHFLKFFVHKKRRIKKEKIIKKNKIINNILNNKIKL